MRKKAIVTYTDIPAFVRRNWSCPQNVVGCLDRDSSWTSPEHKSNALPNDAACFVGAVFISIDKYQCLVGTCSFRLSG